MKTKKLLKSNKKENKVKQLLVVKLLIVLFSILIIPIAEVFTFDFEEGKSG